MAYDPDKPTIHYSVHYLDGTETWVTENDPNEPDWEALNSAFHKLAEHLESIQGKEDIK